MQVLTYLSGNKCKYQVTPLKPDTPSGGGAAEAMDTRQAASTKFDAHFEDQAYNVQATLSKSSTSRTRRTTCRRRLVRVVRVGRGSQRAGGSPYSPWSALGLHWDTRDTRATCDTCDTCAAYYTSSTCSTRYTSPLEDDSRQRHSFLLEPEPEPYPNPHQADISMLLDEHFEAVRDKFNGNLRRNSNPYPNPNPNPTLTEPEP